MMAKREFVIKNDRSLINHEFVTSNATAVFAIYGHANSRTIYIESGQQERELIKYTNSMLNFSRNFSGPCS